jgi:hypothetical protein
LAADWLPSLPPAVAPSLIGWPSFLLESVQIEGDNVLALRDQAGHCERQWKSVVSWMLGVAGTRHFLKNEGFRWVAPVSAFLESAVQQVDLKGWAPAFPKTSVVIKPNPDANTRLMPDYVALRPIYSKGEVTSHEWAVAEAKGCGSSLASVHTCPLVWYQQALNANVEVSGALTRLARRMVVATRVNPNAKRAWARRLQIRAWNRRDDPTPEIPLTYGAVDIVAAHLFGLFKGLRLTMNARAIALAAESRALHGNPLWPGRKLKLQQASEDAARELDERSFVSKLGDSAPDRMFALDSEAGSLLVGLAPPILKLAGSLEDAIDPDAAVEALVEAERSLGTWERVADSRPQRGARLPFGITTMWQEH